MLMAVKFDEQKMAVDGAPVPLGETIVESGQGAAQYGFSRLGSSDIAFYAVWSPDSQRLAFTSGGGRMSSKPSSGSGMEELLMTRQGGMPISWSSDGRFLTYSERSPETGWDIGVLPLDNERKPTIFLQTRFNETTPMISPNGRWLAYTSNESGRYEVYVEPFPQPGEKFQISTAGGFDPVWSHDGHELFYRAGNKMMAVPVDTGVRFVAGKGAELFEGMYWTNSMAGVPNGSFDVSVDGKRFLMIKPAALHPPTQINVVVNWFEDLKRKFQ